ncbi:hypothetical protein JCM3765_002426 [Sporobolomyces pararoseus]
MASLPSSIQDKILAQFAQTVLPRGGLYMYSRKEQLRRLKLVNKHWYAWVVQESARWISFDFCTSPDIVPGLSRKVTFTVKGVKHMLEKRRLLAEGKTVRGIEIKLDNPHRKLFKERSKKWKGALEQVIREARDAHQLQLQLEDGQSASYSELVWRFPHLETLSLQSSLLGQQSILIFPPASKLPPLGSSLSRIDLSYIAIGEWKVVLSNVKILTMEHVTFGGTGQPCRDFFGSFPRLQALAMCRPVNLNSDAFIRLGFSTLVHLYLGDCCYGESTPLGRIGSNSNFSCTDFLRSLARHFRSRIKHFYLPGHVQATGMIDILLSSRIGDTFPAYLVKLKTITIARPPENDGVDQEQSSPSTIPRPPFRSSHCVPPCLLRHLLLVAVHDIVDNGGAEIMMKKYYLTLLSRVCPLWEEICRPFLIQFEVVPLDDKVSELKLELDRIQAIRQGKLKGGGLCLDLDEELDGRDLMARSSRWRKMVEKILVGEFKEISQLHFMVSDEFYHRASYLSLIWYFLQLKSLFISSQLIPDQDTIVMPPLPLPLSLDSLVRLDLSDVQVLTWTTSLPNVKTLTLKHVSFLGQSTQAGVSVTDDADSLDFVNVSDCDEYETTESPTISNYNHEESDACRAARLFLSCIPNLEALGLDGVGGLGPTALSQPRLASITQLYLGRCAFPKPDHPCKSTQGDSFGQSFVEVLKNHLPPQTRIKRLVLSGRSEPTRHLQVLFGTEGSRTTEERVEAPVIFSELQSLQTRWQSKKKVISWKKEQKGLRLELRKVGLDGIYLKQWGAWVGEGPTDWEPENL